MKIESQNGSLKKEPATSKFIRKIQKQEKKKYFNGERYGDDSP